MSRPAPRSRAAALLTALVTVLPLTACSTAEPSGAPRTDTATTPTATPTTPTAPTSPPEPSGAKPTGSSPGAPTRTPAARTPPLPDDPGGRYSLPALMRADLDGRDLRVLGTEARTDAYTRQRVTYRSNGTLVSGVLLRPAGRGPFPAVVLNHGYIEPSVYVTGQGLAREQDWLARAGFVVLHTDYRGHAASDPVGLVDRESRLGYTRDSLNAVLALEKQRYVDADRTAMLGRSMGGGVTLNALVAAPGVVDAAVVYASVSSDAVDNLRRWTLPERPDVARALFDRFGTPRRSPAFWDGWSSRTYFDRVTEPVLMFHGLADSTCPPAWSRTTHRLLREAGARATLVEYPGEEHAFVARWEDSIRRTVRFLRRELGA